MRRAMVRKSLIQADLYQQVAIATSYCLEKSAQLQNYVKFDLSRIDSLHWLLSLTTMGKRRRRRRTHFCIRILPLMQARAQTRESISKCVSATRRTDSNPTLLLGEQRWCQCSDRLFSLLLVLPALSKCQVISMRRTNDSY